MPLTEVETVEHDGEVVSKTERKLYTLAELKENKHLEGRDIVPAHEAAAFERACENISRMMDESGWTQSSLEMEISEYIVPEILGKAGIIVDDKGASIEWDVSPTQGGRFFVLDPKHAKVDVGRFLRAMKGFFEGTDWRGPEYAASEQKPRLPQGKALKKIDLRSADTRMAKESGLFVETVNTHWSSRSSDELVFEPSDYERQFSEEFRQDCNYFFGEVIGFCYRTLEQTYEGEFEEDSLLSAAEANEWHFTAEGQWA